MPRPAAQLRLGAFFNPTGHHVASWRHPGAQADAGINFKHYVEIAQTAERGKFDMVFLADNIGVRDAHMEALSRSAQYIANFEPIPFIPALAAVTERIGLPCTASTSYNEPFHVARKFASLDHISGGRAGWNIVTSAGEAEARNFGIERPPHSERYHRAEEFLQVANALWESWADGAVVGDRRTGVYADLSLVRPIDRVGTHFMVQARLNVQRSPQGRPPLVQAGSSEDGKEFAARFAEAVFTAQQTLEDAQEFYADLKGRLPAYGRRPQDLKILPGVQPIISSTEREALRLEKELEDLIVPAYGVQQLSNILGVDL